jgi:hypothetical protein
MKTNIPHYFKWFIMLMVLTVIVSACANVTPIEQCVTEAPYNFWGGLWHGVIAPVSFSASLYSDDIAMYAVNNNGGWYNFGFLLGIGIIFGGSSRAGKKTKRQPA